MRSDCALGTQPAALYREPLWLLGNRQEPLQRVISASHYRKGTGGRTKPSPVFVAEGLHYFKAARTSDVKRETLNGDVTAEASKCS